MQLVTFQPEIIGTTDALEEMNLRIRDMPPTLLGVSDALTKAQSAMQRFGEGVKDAAATGRRCPDIGR